jgi:hypothetical protein
MNEAGVSNRVHQEKLLFPFFVFVSHASIEYLDSRVFQNVMTLERL